MTSFFGANLALGSALELLCSATELVIAGCHIQTTFHHTSQSNWEMVHVVAKNKKRWHVIMTIILICGQLMRHPVIELFHLFNLLKRPNDCRMVDVEFFSYFSCSCKRISFDDCSQLVVVNFWWLATVLLIFKALVSFAKLLEPPLQCMFISSFWAKCIVDATNCLFCFMTCLELE